MSSQKWGIAGKKSGNNPDFLPRSVSSKGDAAFDVLRMNTMAYLYYMPVKRTIPYTFGTFFITFTNHRWMNLIDEADGYADMHYFHGNPCRGKWNLCRDPTEYIHSSGKFYMTGEVGIYPVIHAGELSEIKLIRNERH